MSFLRSGLRVFIILASFFLISCEEEGNPLTLDDIYEAQEGSRPLFRAFVNGRNFESEIATASKDIDRIVISGSNSDGNISLYLTDFLPGKYLAEENELNQIIYTDMYGKSFISNRADKDSDAEIVITNYNENRSTISGRYSAVVYDPQYDKKEVYISNGVFNDLFVNIPFLGRIDATVNEEEFASKNCIYYLILNGTDTSSAIAARQDNDTANIYMQFLGEIKVKDYLVGTPNVFINYNSDTYSSNFDQHRYSGINGTISIRSVDYSAKRVRGIFNFQAVNNLGDTISFSDGEINALIN